VVDTDATLPGHLRVLFLAVPDDAVPVSDAGPWLHNGTLHRRLPSVPQRETV